MKPVFLDYETYWSATHTLTKMGAISYVMHPETEIQSVSIKIGTDAKSPTRVVFGEERIRKLFAQIDWSDKIVVSHNGNEFDHLISAWRFGLKPAMWGDTLAMARPFFAKTVGGSLKAVAAALGCPLQKGDLNEVGTKGKKLADFTPDEIKKMTEYNVLDTEICAFIFQVLAPRVGRDELKLISDTAWMTVDPQFETDLPLLQKTLDDERARKKLALLTLAEKLGVEEVIDGFGTIEEQVKKQLASAAKFSKLLTSLGVEVPMKYSPTDPTKLIPALSKADEEFQALTTHENDLVAAAARTRLDVKSTLLETRIEKFIEATAAAGGRLPITLRYCGADTTHRWSGWAYNPQNLPRIPRDKEGNIIDKPTNALRLSLRAPKGYKVVVADLSGIELRVNMFLWKVGYAMEMFRADPAKADLYKKLASEMYNVEMSAVTKDQRQIGKILHLGCGFGVGGVKFKDVAKMMGGVRMTPDEAAAAVADYRAAHPEIVQGWKLCHNALPMMLAEEGDWPAIDPWGLCRPVHGGIATPNGKLILYPNLRRIEGENGRSEWVYGEGRHKSRIYAGKIDENIVQHLARQVIAGNAVDFSRTDIGRTARLALTVHDELVYVFPESVAQEALDTLQGIMRMPPTWWPELVTWSEGDIADTYGDAK